MAFSLGDLLILLGLMIPFLGILVPILVLLLFQVSHPEAPAASSEAEGAPVLRPAQPGSPAPHRSRRSAATAKEPIVVDSEELVWFKTRLREVDVFEGLTDNELGYVAALGRRRKVSAGERLAEGGSRGEALFVILEGGLRLLTLTAPESVVRTAHAGESVPLATIIEPPVLVTTVEAESDGEVLEIPRKRLMELFEKQPMIGLQVYRAAAKSFEHRYRETLDRGDATAGGWR